MKVINNEMVCMWDVDNTLVLWDERYNQNNIPEENKVHIVDPYDKENLYLKPHKKHVKILKDHKVRGFTNVVWSAGGYEWALAVVKALNLEEYVDVVMCKPTKFFDDLPANEVLVGRVYLEP